MSTIPRGIRKVGAKRECFYSHEQDRRSTAPFASSRREGGLRLRVNRERVQPIPEALRPGLQACSRGGDTALTRKEMAALFAISTRTVNRWESDFGISAERENARVIRYRPETVVGLVALGKTIVVLEAERLGLNPKAILSLASVLGSRATNAAQVIPVAQKVLLVAESDDDRRLIAAWRDANLGPVLRRILRGLTEQSPALN
jgi:hypothetical protein